MNSICRSVRFRVVSCAYSPPPPKSPWSFVLGTILVTSMVVHDYSKQLYYYDTTLQQRMDRIEQKLGTLCHTK